MKGSGEKIRIVIPPAQEANTFPSYVYFRRNRLSSPGGMCPRHPIRKSDHDLAFCCAAIPAGPQWKACLVPIGCRPSRGGQPS
jgi:hypothetical protein